LGSFDNASRTIAMLPLMTKSLHEFSRSRRRMWGIKFAQCQSFNHLD
jgi:hypothetical protein